MTRELWINRSQVLAGIVVGLLALALAACGDTTNGNGNGSGDGTSGGDTSMGGDGTTGTDTTTVPADATDLPPGAACYVDTQCSGMLRCVGAGDNATFVCGEPNVSGAPAGTRCSTNDECAQNACNNGTCAGPTNPNVVVGTGNACNWLDSPERCGDWNCLYEAGKTVCRHNDQDTPDGQIDWTCQDVTNNGMVQTICTSPGDHGPGQAGWTCNFEASSNSTVCYGPADLPDPDSPGNNGGTDLDWDCDFPDDNGGEVKICTRDGGGPSAGCPAGNVEGLACTPNAAAVSGATVTIHFTDCAGNQTSRSVQSDALGYWSFGSIPAGTATVDITKGPYSVETTVEVVADQTTSMTDGNQRACFDPNNTKIAVVTGSYDSMSDVLTSLGFTFDSYNGVQSEQGWNFLSDPNQVDQYDIIFINCGVYPESEFGARLTQLQTIGQNLRNFVDAGHYLYTSDWAYYFIEAAYPEKIDFRGEDLTAVDVLIGEVGEHAVAITDAELAAYTGQTTALINLDLPSWAVAVDSAADTQRYLVGDARLRDSTVVSGVPFLVDFRSGEGSAVYTSYHIHANDAVSNFFAFLALNFK